MKNSRHITAFYLEMLLLMLVMIVIVLVLTNVFALGRTESAAARSLTDAVCLAQNTAEAAASSGSAEELASMLGERGSAALVDGADKPTVRAVYNAQLEPDADGCYTVLTVWDESAAEGGRLVRCTVTVTASGSAEEIYTLETAVFIKEAQG